MCNGTRSAKETTVTNITPQVRGEINRMFGPRPVSVMMSRPSFELNAAFKKMSTAALLESRSKLRDYVPRGNKAEGKALSIDQQITSEIKSRGVTGTQSTL